MPVIENNPTIFGLYVVTIKIYGTDDCKKTFNRNWLFPPPSSFD